MVGLKTIIFGMLAAPSVVIFKPFTLLQLLGQVMGRYPMQINNSRQPRTALALPTAHAGANTETQFVDTVALDTLVNSSSCGSVRS